MLHWYVLFNPPMQLITCQSVLFGLDIENGDEYVLNLMQIEKTIKARRYEHDNKGSRSAQLMKKIVDCEKSLQSTKPIYRTIRKTAKDEVWQQPQNAVLLIHMML